MWLLHETLVSWKWWLGGWRGDMGGGGGRRGGLHELDELRVVAEEALVPRMRLVDDLSERNPARDTAGWPAFQWNECAQGVNE